MYSIKHDRHRLPNCACFAVEQRQAMLTADISRQLADEVEKGDRDIIWLFDLALPEHVPVGQVTPYFDDQILYASLLPEPGQVGPVSVQLIGRHLILELKRELGQGIHEMVGIRGDL